MDEGGLELEGLLRQRGWLRALARGMVGEDEVDDLLQESWLAALCARARPRTSLGAWFAGLARNAARGMRGRRPGPVLDWAEIPDERARGAELLARAELQERLIAAVRALREPLRSTVLLHYFEGLSLEELGRRTGVPSSTARTRLARALAELRERLGGHREGAGWAVLVELARGGAAGIPSTMLETALMGTMLKLGTGVVVTAGLAFVVWSRVRDSDGRAEARGAAPADVASAGATHDSPAGERAPAADETPLRVPLPVQSSAAAAEAPLSEPVDITAAPPGPSSLERDLERNLDAIADTFLTEEPDAAGLLAIVGELARSVRVVGETAEVHSGRLTGGELVLGEKLKGTFSIDGAKFLVELESAEEREPFFTRALYIGFSDVTGSASEVQATIQYHPKTNEDASQSIGSEEQLVGWGLSVDPLQGTTARPITMKAITDGGLDGWRIGHAEAFQPRELPWISSTHSFDLWLERLRPHRPR